MKAAVLVSKTRDYSIVPDKSHHVVSSYRGSDGKRKEVWPTFAFDLDSASIEFFRLMFAEVEFLDYEPTLSGGCDIVVNVRPIAAHDITKDRKKEALVSLAAAIDFRVGEGRGTYSNVLSALSG